MVKLIRLTTDDDNGIFQANFKNPITIQPQSQLALLHFTAQVKQQTINISFENNLIEFEIAGRTYSCRLSRGTFGRGNYMDLLQDIQDSMNLACIYTDTPVRNPAILGVEWACQDVDNKINIAYEYNLSGGYSNFLEHSADINSLANDVWELDDSVANPQPGYDNAVISKKSISLGNGYIRSRIVDLANPNPAVAFAEQGFLIGLTKTDLTSRSADSLTEEDITYAVGVGYDAGVAQWEYYRQSYNENTQTTDIIQTNIPVDFLGTGDVNNPTLEVMKNGRNVEIAIYDEDNNNNEREVIASVPLIENEEFFAFLIFHSNSDVIKANLKWTPTTDLVNAGSFEPELGAPARNSGAKVNGSLTFGSITLANFLGYELTNQPVVLSKFHNFIADNEFDVKKLLNTFVLELLNLNVESYDSQLEQRKNIIASVLTSDDNGVINNENNVIFIDLNNKDKIDLRNIALRLVGLDYTKVELEGRSICALLLGDKSATSF